MSEVIVVTSGKGGVGKTTTAANIGTGIAATGRKVVVLDADIGLRKQSYLRFSKCNRRKLPFKAGSSKG